MATVLTRSLPTTGMRVVKLLTDPNRLPTLRELEKVYVADVMERSASKAAAARTLGVDRRTLYRLLGKWGGPGGALGGKGVPA